MSLKIAVNFPYFIPYTGFFRLMEYADIFVALDCAQFPRRGYVHRNQLQNANGEPAWLTLDLQRQPREIAIRQIRFVEHIHEYMQRQLLRFPCLHAASGEDHPLTARLLDTDKDVVGYIIGLLEAVNCELGIDCKIIRSSELNLPCGLKGEDRVLSILRLLNAGEYVNAPGGRHLYTPERFAADQIILRLLTHFRGNHYSILQRLMTESKSQVMKDIHGQMTWQT